MPNPRNMYGSAMVSYATILNALASMDMEYPTTQDFRLHLKLPVGYPVSERIKSIVRRGFIVTKTHPTLMRANYFEITEKGREYLRLHTHEIQAAGDFDFEHYCKIDESGAIKQPQLNKGKAAPMDDLFTSQLSGIGSLTKVIEESNQLLNDLKQIRQILERYVESDKENEDLDRSE